MKTLMLAVAFLVTGAAFAEQPAYTPQNIASIVGGAAAGGGLHAATQAAATQYTPAQPTYDRNARLYQYVSACLQDRAGGGVASSSNLNDIIRSSLSRSNF